MRNWTIEPGQFAHMTPQPPEPLENLVEGAGYMLRCGPSFGPGTVHHALASAVMLIADLSERIEQLESKQRYSEAKVKK